MNWRELCVNGESAEREQKKSFCVPLMLCVDMKQVSGLHVHAEY